MGSENFKRGFNFFIWIYLKSIWAWFAKTVWGSDDLRRTLQNMSVGGVAPFGYRCLVYIVSVLYGVDLLATSSASQTMGREHNSPVEMRITRDPEIKVERRYNAIIINFDGIIKSGSIGGDKRRQKAARSRRAPPPALHLITFRRELAPN